DQISDVDLAGLAHGGDVDGTIPPEFILAAAPPPQIPSSTTVAPPPPPAVAPAPVASPTPTPLTATLVDGRVVPGYRPLDVTVQPITMRPSCLSQIRANSTGGRFNLAAQPVTMVRAIRSICSAEDVQAAEDGRLQP